ncbi:M1 family aminopeptidase [Chitinophaga sp. GCM10012297]|uniref:Aminopeptidase N n=1 Tax=Chitinophaga chungangae TaxID=2821488 RepID=A0ABS3YBZ1_9BACT|nr:M1 family aminopeptidase [Chitinophaga chungangae]MBO9152176.1 M1 family metallopeptidase [Chitinophaga chungangae]
MHSQTRKLTGLLLASLAIMGLSLRASAQSAPDKEDPEMKIYRATATKINDLIHTKLDVRFDYAKRYLYGKAWISLKPHFYPTDSLTLDAKGMDVKTVSLVQTSGSATLKFPNEAALKAARTTPLKYEYDGSQIRLKLNKTYKNNESYTIFVEYTAKPDEAKVEGSAAITDAKGLYFINPDGSDPKKPIQIWTQGETESSSVWFPTIDRTNQKTTSEISMTVEKKYVTLSNGKLTSQKSNSDGTRTDTWRMDLPHAPYLFMMAVGDFAIVKDSWRGKEVNYYVEKAYATHAKAIFGNTPEMLTFFSKLLNYDYPWVKYSQIIVRDYVSGAMENTTATIHGDFLQKTQRELLDDDERLGESVIAHELFHHWFGDLATAESWSNLTMNESFADYSEYLWFEHKYGKDAADEHAWSAMNNYQESAEYQGDRDLVRFHYHNKEDMFDAVSYQKGGRILHMLRTYLGDEAFFKALNLYLRNNAFKATEAHQLRLAMEEVSGQDLNWFFNQWYFGQGYPTLDISYDYSQTGSAKVTIEQKGDKVFDLPFAIDVYAGGKKERHDVRLSEKKATFTFPVSARPDFVNVDADKSLIVKKADRRELSTYVFQYKNAPTYFDRREAIEACIKQQTGNAAARATLIAALNDKYEGLRAMAVAGLKIENPEVQSAALPVLTELAKKDKFSQVRAAAIKQLGRLKDAKYMPLFEAALKDPSYMVEGTALNAIAELDIKKAYQLAKTMEKDARGLLGSGIANVYAKNGDVSDVPFFAAKLEESSGQEKIGAAILYLNILASVDDTPTVTKGIDDITAVVTGFNNNWVNDYIVNLMGPIAKKKQEKAAQAAGDQRNALNAQADHILKAIAKIKETGKE